MSQAAFFNMGFDIKRTLILPPNLPIVPFRVELK